MLILKSLAAWFLILCLAIANGALREAVLIPALGKFSGLIISGVLLSAIIALVSYAFVRLQRAVSASQGFKVGILWLCLTLVFEFGVGRYVQHKAWSELLEAYTFKDGNIWPVVLAVTLLAPYFAALLRSRPRHANGGA